MKNGILRTWAVSLISLAAFSSCGKDISIFEKTRDTFSAKGPKCGDEVDRYAWSWQQPELSFSRAVDLLFVTDSSLSLLPERRKLARSISHFLRGLPENADPRIAVMLGHGGKSKWSGRLFSHGSDPRVLDPAVLGEDELVRALEENLTCPKMEWASTNGEALFLSLQKSLKGSRFNEIRSQGFFRDGAAISVVFVSDENEVCFDPRSIGKLGFPDFKDSLLGLEDRALAKYCQGISPESTLAALKDAFPGRKLSVGTIVHSDPEFVCRWGEHSIGHGYLQLASMVPESLVMDIRSGDFDQGLARLASVSTSQLPLMTSFTLTGDERIDEGSVLVYVDGVEVPASFDPETRTVRVAGEDAGGALSRIEVSACPWIEPGNPTDPGIPPISR